MKRSRVQELLPSFPVRPVSGLTETVNCMPIGRYFLFAGSLLLALLFLADRYLPGPIAPSARADVDRSFIRINTRHKWPEAVAYDTSLPTIVPPVLAAAGSPEKPPLEAFAQLPPAPSPAPQQVAEMVPKAPAAKRKARPRSPVSRVANNQSFEARGDFPFRW